jgi:O-antigen/teichoic acid export membrane protein
MTRNSSPKDGPSGDPAADGMSASLANRAVGATWWSALEVSARFGAQFVVLVILARLLSPADFGLVAMVLVFTSIGALLVDSGFSVALIQRQRTSDDDETTVFLFVITASLLLTALLWSLAPLIATFYSHPELVALTRALALTLPFSALSAVPDALLAKTLKFRARARAEVLASSCAGVVALWLAWNNYGVWSLVGHAVVLAALRAALLWLYTGWRPRGRFRISSFHDLFSFGGYMLMSNLLDTLSIRLQSLLIGKLFDSHALGYYTVAQNTQQAPASFFAAILNRVGLPVFSSLAANPKQLLEALRTSLRVAMFLFLPGMVGIAVFAQPLVVLVYGQRWAEAAPILSILALSAAFWPLHVLNLAAITALGRSDLFFRLTVVKKVVLIALVILFSSGGAIGVAWAVLVSSVIAVVVNTRYTEKLLGYGLIAQVVEQRGTLLLSLLAALAGWLAVRSVATEGLAVVVAVTVAALVYLAGAALGMRPVLRELFSLVRAMRPTQGAN